LVTPAPPRSRAGNRATAVRWAQILRRLGHRVSLGVLYDGAPYDCMIALHAHRSASAIREFRHLHPAKALIVALTGTDIYHFIHTDPSTTLASMERADVLVGLHAQVHEALPETMRAKVRVILQSAAPLGRAPSPPSKAFQVCVIGHLREEKDPMLTAVAARALPAESRLRVVHLGRALDDQWALRARREMEENPRYRWRGEVPHWEVRRILSRSHLMTLTSKMEGGANVVSEAIVAGVPVLSAGIPGSVGLLGRDYPGYFPPGDAESLAALLWQAERDREYLAALKARCALLGPHFRPQAEAAAWAELLGKLGNRAESHSEPSPNP
jgi:putative glycosyltransferase (TIGR04348 family)